MSLSSMCSITAVHGLSAARWGMPSAPLASRKEASPQESSGGLATHKREVGFA